MRMIAATLALFVGASCGSASFAQDSAVTNVTVSHHPEATSCSLKRYPHLDLVEASGLSVGAWSNAAPKVLTGPPATLSVQFNKGAKAPWMILLSVEFPVGSDVNEDSVGSWDITIDGVKKHIENLPPPVQILPSLPAGEAPAANSVAPPRPDRGPSLQAEMDDDWFQRIFAARSASIRFVAKDGFELASYQWDIADLGKAKAVLDQVHWSCGAPA